MLALEPSYLTNAIDVALGKSRLVLAFVLSWFRVQHVETLDAAVCKVAKQEHQVRSHEARYVNAERPAAERNRIRAALEEILNALRLVASIMTVHRTPSRKLRV